MVPVGWKDRLRQRRGLPGRIRSVPYPGTTFSYAPLDRRRSEIRLLKPKKRTVGAGNQTLSFELVKLDLDSVVRKQYYAVSYTWGENPGKATIFIDGIEVAVPDSAEGALRGVLAGVTSGKHVIRPIWIDAVCINQSDLTEKMHQVSMMGRIYSRSLMVFVWLGPDEDDEMQTLIETCEALQLEYEQKSLKRRRNIIPGSERPDNPNVDLPFPAGADQQTFFSFLGCRWFQRLWVVQEAILAKRLVFLRGGSSISWEAFTSAVKWVYNSRNIDYTDGRLSSFVSIVRLKELPHNTALSDLLITTFGYQASNPLDKIYALLAMVNDVRTADLESQVPPLRPDYTRNVQEAYTEAMFHIMEVSECLEALSVAQCLMPVPESLLESWPSWVPRLWDAQLGVQNVFPMGTDAYNADNDVKTEIHLDFSSQSPLQIGGVVVDIVTEIIQDLQILPREGMRIAEVRADIMESFWYSKLCWNRLSIECIAECLVDEPCETTGQNFGAYLLALKDARGWTCQSDLERVLVELDAEGGTAESFEKAFKTFDHHLLFALEGGGYGISHDGTKPGDKVCILFGADEPYIMRDVNTSWKLRGIAYVPGINKGEYIQKLQDQGRLDSETLLFRIN